MEKEMKHRIEKCLSWAPQVHFREHWTGKYDFNTQELLEIITFFEWSQIIKVCQIYFIRHYVINIMITL